MYEKTNTGAIKKYYAGFGRTVAVRDVPTGTGTGTLSYILPDHLGSASVVTSDAGAVISEMTYWPYGATRSGGITQTDKRYTGQQEEPGDAALGLYNYKARFYSTTLGRFLSSDPTNDGLNRYSYAANNPLRYVDPSGLTAVVGCGTGHQCETGNPEHLNRYRNAIQQEWREEGRYPGSDQAFLDWIFDRWFLPAMAERGYNGQQSADVFGLVFVDTGGLWQNGVDIIRDRNNLPEIDEFLEAHRRFGFRGADTWIGYSQGAAVAWGAVLRMWNDFGPLTTPLPRGIVLIQPPIGRTHGPDGLVNLISVVVVNGPNAGQRRGPDIPYLKDAYIDGATLLVTRECMGANSNHCAHPSVQALAVHIAHIPPPYPISVPPGVETEYP